MPQAAVLTAPRTIQIEQRASLSPRTGEVILEIEHTGVCGTDLALFAGDYPVPLPMVPGHEFVGRVASVGEEVESSLVGKRVVADINNTCVAWNRAPLCTACERGMPSHCLDRTVTGIIQKDGAFAYELAIPAGCLHPVPAAIDPLTAVLTEPLAAALQTFEMTPLPRDETVVVLGPGRLGILIVFAAMLKGANVIAVSRSEAKRKRALQFGAQSALSPENALAEIKSQTKGLGADVVVDATGHPDGTDLALSLVRPRGTLAVKTTCGLPVHGLDMTKLVVDEIRLQGSRCGPFPKALDILAQHQDQLKPLITSVQPLSMAQKAFESAFHEDKVVLTPEAV